MTTLLISDYCLADSIEKPTRPPTSIVATFQKGAWVEEEQDTCPILRHRTESRIAIFSKDSSDAVMKLADRIDTLVAGHEQLKSSFLFVSHENQPTPSEHEWNQQFEMLKKQTAKFEIQNLAAGLMIRLPDETAVTRARRRVGVFQEGDIVVMLIVPQQSTYGVVSESIALRSSELTDEKLNSVCEQLTAAANSLPE